jgi:tetratricopeptide (TPR) repeat protein
MQNDKTKDQAPELIVKPEPPEEISDGNDPVKALQETLECSRRISSGGSEPKKRKRMQEMQPAKRESFFKSVPFRFGAVMLTALMLLCLVYSSARAAGLSTYSLGFWAAGGLLEATPFVMGHMQEYPRLGSAFDQDRYENMVALLKVNEDHNGRLDSTAHASLAYAYSQLGDYKQALEHHKKWFHESENSSVPSSVGASAYSDAYVAMLDEQSGDFQSALDHYKISEEKRSSLQKEYDWSSGSFFPNLRWARVEWGRFHPPPHDRSALPALNRHGYLSDALLSNNISHCYVELKNPTLAIEYANKAIACDPSCVPAYKNRALAELQAGDLHTALADANKALAMDKDYVAGLMARSDIFAQLGDKPNSDADRILADRLKQKLLGAAS